MVEPAALRRAPATLKEKADRSRAAGNYRGQEIRDHGTRCAKGILTAGLRTFRLAPDDLASLPKGAPQKAIIAREMRRRTSAPLAWVADQLHMGSTSNVSQATRRLAHILDADPALRELEAKFLSRIPS